MTHFYLDNAKVITIYIKQTFEPVLRLGDVHDRQLGSYHHLHHLTECYVSMCNISKYLSQNKLTRDTLGGSMG